MALGQNRAEEHPKQCSTKDACEHAAALF